MKKLERKRRCRKHSIPQACNFSSFPLFSPLAVKYVALIFQITFLFLLPQREGKFLSEKPIKKNGIFSHLQGSNATKLVSKRENERERERERENERGFKQGKKKIESFFSLSHFCLKTPSLLSVSSHSLSLFLSLVSQK